MTFNQRTIVIFLAGCLVTLLIPLAIIATGFINMGADVPAGALERGLGHWAYERSVAVRAPNTIQLPPNSEATLAAGLAHFRENCLLCHGAPAIDPDEMAKGLNPPAPSLTSEAMTLSDGALFWVVKHGIRMTPMPAFGPSHTDAEILQIVAFVRHLPQLSNEERIALTGQSTGSHHKPADGAHEHR